MFTFFFPSTSQVNIHFGSRREKEFPAQLDRRADAAFEAISLSRRVELLPREKRKAEPTGDLPGKTCPKVHY